MLRLMVMNGLLISLILIWTSSASEPPKELRSEPQAEAQVGPKEDPKIVSNKSKKYEFTPSISNEEDFNIMKPHNGIDNTITRKENHTYSRVRGEHKKESGSNLTLRDLKSGSQLLFFSAGKLSWIDAQKDCKARNGALAVLGDEPEDVFAFISENIGRKYFWLGGSDIKEEGNWLWLNGDPIDHTKYWRRGEPNGGESDDCLYLYRGIYYDRSCKREYNYICDLESDANIPFHERTQYLSFSDDSMYWEDAKANCEAKQGTLAILEDEPDDVFAHIASHYAGISFWLGGSDIAKEGNWLWLNGNPIDLTKYWRRNEPNNWWGGEDCLEYYYGYRDRSCRRRTRYICDLGAPSTAAPTTAAPTTAAPTTAAPTTAAPTTAAPTTSAPPTAAPTTAGPTTTAPSITHTNATSCSLVWNYEEDRPLIMIRETKTIVPPITDIAISIDPNRIPEGKKIIFACPGENNQFNHVQGTHTKLHGECISPELFKVCVNNNPEILDLSQLSCSRQMSPSIIKQDNDTIYKKSCDVVGGELYKFGYIYGDYKEFKDLENNICFREKDQKTLWTSSNLKSNAISPSVRFKDPFNNSMNTEDTSVWNDLACRNHGGHCVRGGKPCPKHLPYQTSQGEPFCSSFYRCCFSETCQPTTCTYKGQTGNCGLDSLPGTIKVGTQECNKGCQCYIKDNTKSYQSNKDTMRQFENVQKRKELSKLMERMLCGSGGGGDNCILDWIDEKSDYPPLVSIVNGAIIYPTMIKTEKKIRIDNSVSVVFACSKTVFQERKVPTIHAKCVAGKLLDLDNENKEIEWKKIKCEKMIEPSVTEFKPKTEEDIQDQNTCTNLKGLMWKYGFEIGTTEHPPFYTMIYACFDKSQKRTIFTRSNIHGKNLHAKYARGKDPEVMWKLPPAPKEMFFGEMDDLKDFNEMFKFEEQNTYFTNVLGLPDFISSLKYFNQGHMAARSDFITKAEQEASHNYILALPQYKKSNSENWAHIEQAIQDYAKIRETTFTIYTFGDETPVTIGEMKLYIGNPKDGSNINKRLAVPNFFSKTVKEIGVTFVSYNNEYDSKLSFKCPGNKDGSCDTSDFNWISESYRKLLRDPKRGHILCCKN